MKRYAEAAKAEIIYHAKACERALLVADALASTTPVAAIGCNAVAYLHSLDAFNAARRLHEVNHA